MKEIPPGSNATATTVHNLNGRSGKQHLSVYLHSNDPANPVLQLLCRGIVASSGGTAGNEAIPDVKDRAPQTAALPDETHTRPPAQAVAANAESLLKEPVVPTPPQAPVVQTLSAQTGVASTSVAPLRVEFMYEPGCAECERIEREVLPRLSSTCANLYTLERRDIGVASNYMILADYMDRFHEDDNEHVFMAVNGQSLLAGYREISESLERTVQMASGAGRIDPASNQDDQDPMPRGADRIQDRFYSFTAVMVAGAGLLDGINPCAISTLVFFMSLLAVARINGRGLFMMGISFCLASFLTYTAIGLGFLRAIHLLSGFTTLRTAIEWGVTAALMVLAYLSFRDAYRYRQSGRADDVTLQLPDALKARIHARLRQGVRGSNLVLSGFTLGFTVTAIESVCTGQVYVPTLILMTRNSDTAARAWSYLLLYNTMFIVPLATVFTVVLFGARTHALVEWSRVHLVWSKILLGAFFLCMALTMAALSRAS